MVSNHQDLHQVGIDEFLRGLRSLGVKNDDISGEPLKIKYSSVAPYGANQRHSTPVKYEHEKPEEEEEGDDEEEVVKLSPKRRVHKSKKRSSLQVGKGYIHKLPGRKPNILYVY